MLAKVRPRLTYANVVSSICLCLVVGGGSAYAADTIGSSDVINESLLSEDIKNGEVKSPDIGTQAVIRPKISNGAVDGTKVLDFGLTNQDIGVLFAEVNANGTPANSSGGVTSARIDVGQYEVDFGRNISQCTAVATVGSANDTLVNGVVNVADRFGNVEAVLADTNVASGGAADRSFRLVVVC